MEFKVHQIDIPDDNPFLNDKLERKNEIENISKLLLNFSSPLVFSINAPWGSGKTTFVKMLHKNLKHQNYLSVYFNAWETDFAKEPLVAFIGEMNMELKGYLAENKTQLAAWEKAKKVGSQIIKRSIPVAIKLGTAGVIDADKIIEDEISNLMKDFTDDIISEYSKSKDLIINFKKNIEKVLEDDNGEKKKLFLFVDELDRCRPTYAIELLERIKHLLNIEGIIFIISLDKEQLSHSVKSLYGEYFDSLGYLKRFFDIEYSLKVNSYNQFIQYNYHWFNFDLYFEKRKKYIDFTYDASHLLHTIKFLVSIGKLSLREIEQMFAKINLVLLSTSENKYIFPVLLVFLLFVKEKNNKVYNNFIINDSSQDEIIQYLYSLLPENLRFKSNECSMIEGYLIAAKCKNNNSLDVALQKHRLLLNSENSTIDQKNYSNTVILISQNPTDWRSQVNLEYLITRIDLLEQFQFQD